MNEIEVAVEAARAAGAILAQRRPREVRTKSVAFDLVTEVDKACEAAIREVLHRHMPDVPVLGEEGGGERGDGPRWVVDPIDGTTNFVHGFPFYVVSVALQVDGRSEVGVVVDPCRGREIVAVRGKGAFKRSSRTSRRGLGGERLRVSDVADLSGALSATGFPYDRRRKAAFYLKFVEAILMRTQGIRRAGAAALDLTLIGEGALDVYWEFHLSLWDVAAGMLFVEEAGGKVTSHDGGPLNPADPCPLATNGRLHEAMIGLLAEAGKGNPEPA